MFRVRLFFRETLVYQVCDGTSRGLQYGYAHRGPQSGRLVSDFP